MVNYKIKSVGAYICLFDFAVYHNLANKQTEKHPLGSILYTVKCACEDVVSPHSTLRRVYIYTPWQSLRQCFCWQFECGSFEIQKQSVSNAFQYVVLYPVGSALHREHHSQYGQIAITKIQIFCLCSAVFWRICNFLFAAWDNRFPAPPYRASVIPRYVLGSMGWNVSSEGWNVCSKGWNGTDIGDKTSYLTRQRHRMCQE